MTNRPASAAVVGSEVIRMDIRLMGADLIDELIYEWKKKSPATDPLNLVLAEIIAPVGLDDRFQLEVENRLYEVLRLNPDLPISLVHCSLCTRMVAKSNPKGTIITRGIDQMDALQELEKQMPGRTALALHFEAVGRELQLRARIFQLQPPQKIVWAKTLSTSMSARRALQDPTRIVGLDEARKEQNDIIAGRSTLSFTTRPVLRMFNSANSAVQVAPLPFFEQSVESQLLPAKTVTSALTFGFSSLKDSLEAWTVGGHVAKLLGEPSLTQPDLFMFLGVHYIRMRGATAAVFSADGENLFLQRIRPGAEPKASLVAFRLGLEVHVKYRLGMLAFLENIPLLNESETVETKSLLVPYHALGWGVVWRW
jgi:hypothetical protein